MHSVMVAVMASAKQRDLKQKAKSNADLCPDQLRVLEPHDGELDTPLPILRASPIWCLPTWMAEALPPAMQSSCSQVACTSCSASPATNIMCMISIEILGLSVFGDGLLVLPAPRESTMFDPRTWFAWKPVVEINGAGTPIRSAEGKRAAPAHDTGNQASEGNWSGLTFKDSSGSGCATVSVSSESVLRFRILRSRSTTLLGTEPAHTEEAFTANLHMEHDFFAQGCPNRVARPIFYRNSDGDIRHIGNMDVNLQVVSGDRPAVRSLHSSQNAPATASAASKSRKLRVPEDHATIQAALDAIPAARGTAGLGHVVIGNGSYRQDLRICKGVVLEPAAGASPILEGNVVIDPGGEQAEIRHLTLRGSISIHAGAPLINGCTIVESGVTSKVMSSANSVAAVTVSGSGVKPNIESNKIHQGHGPGVLFENGALGTLRDNTVGSNAGSGVEARDHGTNPSVEGNKILENLQHGIFVHYGASGTFKNNDIHRNKQSGIMLQADTGSGLVVRGNRVHENDQGGIVSEGLSVSTAERDIGDNEEIGPPRPHDAAK